MTTHRFLAFALLALLASAAAGAPCRPAARLVTQALERDEWGALVATASFEIDSQKLETSTRLPVRIETRLDLRSQPLSGLEKAVVCVSIVVDAEGELPVAYERQVAVPALGGARAWSFAVDLELPAATEQILVVIEETSTGSWATVAAEESDTALTAPSARSVVLEGSPAAGHALEADRGAAAQQTETRQAETRRQNTVRIVPPQRQPVSGSTRIETLVTDPEIERVVFFLDGQQVAERERRPFLARIDLADPPRVQELRAVAYDRKGFELGADTLKINELDVPFRVAISEVRGDPASGAVEVEAQVKVPPGARLAGVELYFNDELRERWSAPPYRAEVAVSEPRYGDYLRVVAMLEDGSSIDAVALLGAPAEEVEVNLVQLYAVVTGKDGVPIEDLRAEEVTILDRGEKRQVERFAYANDVALLLGLVIDTSGSMRLLIDATQRAAAKFLGDTLRANDSGFVVDFDERPRLLQATTREMVELFRSLARLDAEGKTALYDAVIFSMLQFERQPGRKALVVLSDGDDRDSRFGPRDAIDYSRKLGVPVYVIGLGALDGQARSLPKGELRKLASETGGGLYLVESFDELDAAYARINAELRNQYSLGFYTPADLSDEAKRKLEVRIARPGVSARVVVGQSATP